MEIRFAKICLFSSHLIILSSSGKRRLIEFQNPRLSEDTIKAFFCNEKEFANSSLTSKREKRGKFQRAYFPH